MKTICRIVVAAAVAVGVAGLANAAEPFKDGDRVVFFGDSITHGGRYGEYVNLFYATRYPGCRIWFSNSGWSGATAQQGLWSIEEDIVAKKPTVVTVMFGMNDINRDAWPRTGDTPELAAMRESAIKTYDEKMSELVRRVRAEAGSPEIIYFTPSPYDQTCLVGGKPSDIVCNDGLAILADHVRSWAASDKATCVDLQGSMCAINEAMQKKDPSASLVRSSPSHFDRVHPGPLGHTVMLYEILKAQKADGLVDEIERDALGADSLVFSCTERALPFPMTSEMRGALALVPFERDFNREILRVKGLKEGRHSVKIDGSEIGSWSAKELAEGVNIALNDKTPQYRQATEAAGICQRLWIGERMLRDFATSRRWVKMHYGEDPDSPGTVEKIIDRLLAEGHGEDSYGVRKYRAYLKDWPRHAEIEAAVEKDRAELASAVRPMERLFEIGPAPSGSAVKTKVVKDIAYADRQGCLLDVRIPVDAANFPTVVWFHGGGLTGGGRHFVSLADEKIAQVAVDYRLLGKGAARGEDCIEDAAAAVAWTLRHIGEYGGDGNKVFVSGMSAGGYLTMMVGMDPKWLAAHGVRNTDLAGLVPISGQATKHFNVRRFSGDDDPQFLPKIDGLAPLAHVAADLPPLLSVCGQPPYEWKCRAEENRLLVASCVALGHKNATFVELDYCDHGRAYAAGLPYLELFVEGRLAGPAAAMGTGGAGKAQPVSSPAPADRLAEMRAKIEKAHAVKAVDRFFGFDRIVFDFDGHDAWVVSPKGRARPGKPWTWTMQWATAFVPRTNVPQMLDDGFHHVTIDTFRHRMDEEGLKVSAAFQKFLVEELGFASKAHLIGMSWGGFFSTRYAANYPQNVAKVYLDAPLLCFNGFSQDIGPWTERLPGNGWEASPEMPLNMAEMLAATKIPVLLLYGGVDAVVPPARNCEPFATRFKAAGGDIMVVKRDLYAHHPHGVEVDETLVKDFFCAPAEERQAE